MLGHVPANLPALRPAALPARPRRMDKEVPPGPAVRRLQSGAFEITAWRDPDGMFRASDEYRTRKAAEAALAAMIAAMPAHLRPRNRTCLHPDCTTIFRSDGPHHRFCAAHRGQG